ncbi:hypothetical protein N7493_001619 [Penicillium malachiteum]|uniref:Centromere protein Cenp-O n=1 Tax=Penicillium malachiteum TaxID=1324776 RepID=A0AAD6HUH4_9EURO|nr:hypothetical protein N7493_001619 [Penicillium malachiteum]
MNTRANHSATPDPEAEQLDSEIASIRTQIQNLKRRKRFLSSSLLASPNVQPLLRKSPTTLDDDLSPLAQAAGKHSTTNHYRIAFGTTAFPFKDPSPTASSENLLGVRIDVSTRNGRFAKPYYILLQRERARGEKEMKLRVHRHTVPSFISMSKLEDVYLPSNKKVSSANEESDGDDSEEEMRKLKAKGNTRKQDLRAFVRELRRELVAWHLRCDAVEMLRERLGLGDDAESNSVDRLSPESKAGIVSLDSTSIETRYVRLEWEDGRVGRFKLSNTGHVERAVVIGDLGRDKAIEDAMIGDGAKVETLLERLKEHTS